MSEPDDRFYERKILWCPLCDVGLVIKPYRSAIAGKDSMCYEHELNDCERSGRSYYLRQHELTPIPKENLNA